jgi:hypothetical protein
MVAAEARQARSRGAAQGVATTGDQGNGLRRGARAADDTARARW